MKKGHLAPHTIYLDNASTTFPKAPGIAEAIISYLTSTTGNANRTNSTATYQLGETIYQCRHILAALFNVPKAKQIIFTNNVTTSLNILLKGYLKPGDHVITSSMEHNAVIRPLFQLQKQGVELSFINCYSDGTLDTNNLDNLVKENTKLVVITHASNVCGTLIPLEIISEFCKKHHLHLIIDAAQTAGVYPIDMTALQASAIAFTGHKGLLGPQGIGGFAITEEFANEIEPLLSGGTGSLSHSEEVPTFLPDRFEPGTLNIPGILGLYESLSYINQIGIANIRKKEGALVDYFLQKLTNLVATNKIHILGLPTATNRTSIISITTPQQDEAEVAQKLSDAYHITTRVGLHCAPIAHRTLGTYPTGTIRFSLGHFTTKEEIDYAVEALTEILCTKAQHTKKEMPWN